MLREKTAPNLDRQYAALSFVKNFHMPTDVCQVLTFSTHIFTLTSTRCKNLKEHCCVRGQKERMPVLSLKVQSKDLRYSDCANKGASSFTQCL